MNGVSKNDMPRVCLIGAGSSGLPCIKALRDAGIPVDCYEAGSAIGGNWRIDNDNGMSSAYESLHINTSRPRMQVDFDEYLWRLRRARRQGRHRARGSRQHAFWSRMGRSSTPA